MKTITEQREAHTLTVKVRYDEGIMTRKEWIELKHSQGCYVEQGTKNRIDFNRTKYNRMNGREQEEYEKKCEEKVPYYKLKTKGQSIYTEITKAEFNYFNMLKP